MSELLNLSPLIPEHDRRVVMFADFLPPDFGAVGQYMVLRARAFATRGHVVELFGLTSGVASIEHSVHDGGSLTIIRIPARPVPRRSLVARLAWTVATNARLVARAFRSLRAADGILFTGSPPFLIHLLSPLKSFLRGRLIYWITDFHPECLSAALDRSPLGLRLLQRLTDFWRRRVDAFEVLGEDQKRRLRDKGIPEDRISLVRTGSPISFSNEQSPEPLPPQLAGKCVLLYSGNLGVAHEIETIAQGYLLHHRTGSGSVHLWLNATGVGAMSLADRLSAAGVPFFHSMPVPLERLAGILLSANAHLITLKDAFVGLVVPSKVYACLDSGRPLLFVGSSESDVDLLARRRSGRAYWRVACGDVAGFAGALERLALLCNAAKRREC